jgi:hypothetical protein
MKWGIWCFENVYHLTDLMIMVYIELSKNLLYLENL